MNALASASRATAMIAAIALASTACSRQVAQPAPTLPPWAKAEALYTIHDVQHPEDLIDFTRAVSGMVGPESAWIVAVPHEGGGSGGAFTFVVYGLRDGTLQRIQEIQTPDGGIRSLQIAHKRLFVRDASFKYGGLNCCPNAYGIAVYEYRRGHGLVPVSYAIRRIR